MSVKSYSAAGEKVPPFKKQFFESGEVITRIGTGSLGGKALGLAFIKDTLASKINPSDYDNITVNIPTLAVIATDFFDRFMQINNLYDTNFEEMPDDRIAHAFQNAELPPELNGDLRRLIADVHTPLAIRSSSLLEDAIYEPFAGVYGTKMIPNNQPGTDARFSKLVEAIKFVYSSVFFREARDYIRATRQSIESEKMAVIIQEVVGLRHWERYYPDISGVARSYNFYPTSHARPEDGVVDLALGLGKTIVDGGTVWSYSPAYPKSVPPYNSIGDLMKLTQTKFWAINMGKPPKYDPTKETEYMIQGGLKDAELDGTLDLAASTYVPERDRISPGTGPRGPRIINFAPILTVNQIPLNNLIKDLLKACEDAVGAAVETEFALTIDNKQKDRPIRLGFLQVRPMVVSDAEVKVTDDELNSENALVASENVLGNGVVDDITDIVYVRPDAFNPGNTQQIAADIEKLNRNLVNSGTPYVLIGFGRWGSSDPWLGINVNWAQISGSRVIVESTLPNMNVELSQGSHFFHNITSFQIPYFSVRFDGKYKIRWDRLEKQKAEAETEYVRHVKLERPLNVKVDGRSGRGVIL
ncbi:MAG TPA: hypothetical protein ENO22_05935 [candidate division Zixibacteria bacterium]|nr:hypothetical protein [candidate division Zixibacteria bacterium]HEQ98863.1 hypothetical protein [candidate division Zixibacteria bacterium]